MIDAPPAPSRLRRRPANTAANQLQILSQQPQGGAFNDSVGDTGGVNCTPGFPYHFDVFLPSNVLKLNYSKLSFFLRAFRTDIASITAGGTNHYHIAIATAAGAIIQTLGLTAAGDVGASGAGGGVITSTELPSSPDVPDSSPHSLGPFTAAPHTHPMTLGIFEDAVATGVKVKVNGVDRTSALGGGTGFTTNQTELEVSQWLTVGAWNVIDLTPTGLGRISAHLRLTGYIQSV